MPVKVYGFGILLTIIGICLGLWRKKRQFDRTNAFGVEQFQGFGRKLLATTLDNILCWISVASLSVGLFILVIA